MNSSVKSLRHFLISGSQDTGLQRNIADEERACSSKLDSGGTPRLISDFTCSLCAQQQQDDGRGERHGNDTNAAARFIMHTIEYSICP